jgi:hypothetical protein
MPHPIPHLHEILALEAQVHADKYDLYPDQPGDWNHRCKIAARLEASLLRDIVYIKK